MTVQSVRVKSSVKDVVVSVDRRSYCAEEELSGSVGSTSCKASGGPSDRELSHRAIERSRSQSVSRQRTEAVYDFVHRLSSVVLQSPTSCQSETEYFLVVSIVFDNTGSGASL